MGHAKVALVLVMVVLVVGVAIAALPRVGELGPIDSRIASAHAKRVFDAAVWQTGDSVARGAMLSDLARNRRFVGKHADSVVALLGPGRDCHVYYADEPCYRLRLGHSSFQLQFRLDHADQRGHVLDVDLVKQ